MRALVPALSPGLQARRRTSAPNLHRGGCQLHLALGISKHEPGTFQMLNFGEDVQFDEAKDSGDFKSSIRRCLQAFASGAGRAEYQIMQRVSISGGQAAGVAKPSAGKTQRAGRR